MRILVVEDDHLLNNTLSYNLSAVGYSVDGAMSKAVAIRFLEKQDYDLIVLDVNLPDGNGFDICRESHVDICKSLILCKECTGKSYQTVGNHKSENFIPVCVDTLGA